LDPEAAHRRARTGVVHGVEDGARSARVAEQDSRTAANAGFVLSASFDRRGRTLLTAGTNGTTRMFDVASRRQSFVAARQHARQRDDRPRCIRQLGGNSSSRSQATQSTPYTASPSQAQPSFSAPGFTRTTSARRFGNGNCRVGKIHRSYSKTVKRGRAPRSHEFGGRVARPTPTRRAALADCARALHPPQEVSPGLEAEKCLQMELLHWKRRDTHLQGCVPEGRPQRHRAKRFSPANRLEPTPGFEPRTPSLRAI
jgi:hypothetical protein